MIDFSSNLTEDLRKSHVTTGVLCDSFLFLNEDSKKTPAYLDPRYIPFYYYLGKYIKPKRMIEIGMRLGMFSSCFLKSCKTVENLTAFQQKTSSFYSPRLAIHNIRKNYSGHIEVMMEEELPELAGRFDLAIVNEELGYDIHRVYLDTLWEAVDSGGFIVHDYLNSHKPAGTAFSDFAKIKNRKIISFSTRYGVGIVLK